MQSDLRVAVVQRAAASVFSDAGAWRANVAEVAAAIRSLAGQTDLAVFPELTLTGYIPLKGYDQRRKSLLWQTAVELQAEGLEPLRAACREVELAAVIGLPEPAGPDNEMYNSALVIDRGRVLGYQRKLHLPVEENHYFVPGPAPRVFAAGCGRLGPLVCYDLVFPEASRLVARQGVDVLVVISNWIDDRNLRLLGEALPVARALENQVAVVFCNGVGELEVRQYRFQLYGRSRVVDAAGAVVAEAGPEPGVLQARLPAEGWRQGAAVFPVFRDRRIDLYAPLALPLPGCEPDRLGGEGQ